MSKPTLKHFASLWTLMDYPNGSASGEWPMEKKFAAIKEAGFAGFQSGALPELKDLAEKYDLACLGGCQANAGNYSQILRDFAPMNTVRINVQLGHHAMQPEEAVLRSAWRNAAFSGSTRCRSLVVCKETLRDFARISRTWPPCSRSALTRCRWYPGTLIVRA